MAGWLFFQFINKETLFLLTNTHRKIKLRETFHYLSHEWPSANLWVLLSYRSLRTLFRSKPSNNKYSKKKKGWVKEVREYFMWFDDLSFVFSHYLLNTHSQHWLRLDFFHKLNFFHIVHWHSSVIQRHHFLILESRDGEEKKINKIKRKMNEKSFSFIFIPLRREIVKKYLAQVNRSAMRARRWEKFLTPKKLRWNFYSFFFCWLKILTMF